MDKNKRTYSRSFDEIDPLIQSPTPMKLQALPKPHQQEPHQQSSHNGLSPGISLKPRISLEPSYNGSKLLPGINLKDKNSLEPYTQLNDTIIEFYMNYLLQNNVQSIRREQIHVFSTFFYNKIKKLPQLDETKLNESVRRWDRHVKLFDKDYLIIPICDCHHWTLAIVCFPRQIPAHDDPIVINQNSDLKHQPKGCMFLLDSLFVRYMKKFTDPVRSFLHSRWSFERPNEEIRNFKDRGAFKEIYAKVPKQRNSYDCGIYLLNSFEKFISDPLHHYYKIREGRDLSSEWAVDPRRKRDMIKQLLYEK